MRLSWHEFANAAQRRVMETTDMQRQLMILDSLTTQTATGLSGLGCAIDGGLGTITMITTTSWTRGAAGVR
ncbi:MAG: hypothetical protein NXI03_09295 [Alphaproteobacteria bacterium]|nr:hypothetical protein [Alphaproteobacteria bacterium]